MPQEADSQLNVPSPRTAECVSLSHLNCVVCCCCCCSVHFEKGMKSKLINECYNGINVRSRQIVGKPFAVAVHQILYHSLHASLDSSFLLKTVAVEKLQCDSQCRGLHNLAGPCGGGPGVPCTHGVAYPMRRVFARCSSCRTLRCRSGLLPVIKLMGTNTNTNIQTCDTLCFRTILRGTRS